MGKPTDTGAGPNDILRLIADVHDNTPAEEDRLDAALGTLESTHRRASAAMQRFERTGRTGRTGLGERAMPQGSLSLGTAQSSGQEPDGQRGTTTAAQAKARARAGLTPASKEVTQLGTRPQRPDSDGGLGPTEERTHTAIARPQNTIPVAEVLSGRGAEFEDRGHTRTHIVRPKGKPTKP